MSAHAGGSADATVAAEALGHVMMSMLTDAIGAPAAVRFADSITQPTKPGTPERAVSDKAWALLTARLAKLTGGES